VVRRQRLGGGCCFQFLGRGLLVQVSHMFVHWGRREGCQLTSLRGELVAVETRQAGARRPRTDLLRQARGRVEPHQVEGADSVVPVKLDRPGDAVVELCGAGG